MRSNLKTLALVCGLATSAQGFSQTTDPINVVTSAVPFLRISPDARSGGMGDMGVATSPDANSMFFNLAKTPFTKTNAAVALTYTPWLKSIGVNDVYLASLSGYYKLDQLSAISGSLRYFNLGSIQFTDFNSPITVSVGKPTELSVGFGYSRKLSDKLGVGIALNYINSNLTRGYAGSTTYKAGSTVAGDLSVYYDNTTEQGAGLRLGLALSNLGGKIGYTTDATQKDYIPANLSLGATNTSVLDESNKITYGIEFSKLLVPTPPLPTNPVDASKDSANLADYRNKGVVSSWFSSFGDMKAVTAGLGAEYSYEDQFFARAGYFYEDKTRGNRKFFTVGLGIKYEVFNLNFSYLVSSGTGINQSPLANTLRFSLVFDLGNTEK